MIFIGKTYITDALIAKLGITAIYIGKDKAWPAGRGILLDENKNRFTIEDSIDFINVDD